MLKNRELPLVSCIVACRNEREYLPSCLDSILAFDYPVEKLEVLILDGDSTDGSREIIDKYITRCSSVRLLKNPKKTVPCAFNLGIEASKGKYIFIMGAHAVYPKNYIKLCLEYKRKWAADNVGGVIKTIVKSDMPSGRFFGYVLSSRFGVGNADFRIGVNKPKWVDTVFGGCYCRSIFDKIGFYNEKLVRFQDIELNLRLQAAGMRTLIVPEIVVEYIYNRTSVTAFLRHCFIKGRWAILPFRYSEVLPVSIRHLVPLIFVATLFILSLLSMYFYFAFYLLALILILYMLCALGFSFLIARDRKDPAAAFLLPVLFFSIHAFYGLGSCTALMHSLYFIDFRVNLLKLLRKRLIQILL